MIVWRICNYLELSGRGGLRASARWHNAGAPIVYTASSPASALLEVMVHLELGELEKLPDSYQLLQIQVSHSIVSSAINESSLTSDWRVDLDATRAIGDEWLTASDSVLLSVPSAIVPLTQNHLINPLHHDIKKIKTQSHGSFPFDFRLFKGIA